MRLAYALADVVIARAGFGTLSELAALAKPAVIIAMSGTHQEDNARFLADQQAIIRLDERVDDGLKLAQVVRQMLERPNQARQLGLRLEAVLPRAKPARLVAMVEELVK